MTRRHPRNRAQKGIERPAREQYATRTLGFESGGATCRGTLYLPADVDQPPVVVMAPPLGATRSFGLPAFAERLAVAGYAAFAFDYRGFGGSDGDDRLVDPARQRADLEAAVSRADRVDDVGHETVLWGADLGGGHALTVAADRTDVDAVVALTPITKGRSFVQQRGLPLTVRAVAGGLRDALGHRVRLGRDAPIVDDDAKLALIRGRGVKRQYLDVVDRDSDWRNVTSARSLLELVRYGAVSDPESIRAPALLLAGSRDELVPAAGVRELAEALPAGTLVRMPADHFSVYGDDFEPVVGHVESFLVDALE